MKKKGEAWLAVFYLGLKAGRFREEGWDGHFTTVNLNRSSVRGTIYPKAAVSQ